MTESKHIGEGTIHLLVSEFIFLIAGYIIYIGLSRMITPQEFGIYGVIVTLATIITMIFNASIIQSVSKFISERSEDAESITSTIFRGQLVLSIIVTALYFLLSPYIAMLFNDPSLTPYIRLSSLLILVNPSLYTLIGYFNGLKKFKLQAIAQNVNVISKVIFIFLFVYIGWAVTGAVLGFIVAGFIAFFVSYFVSKIGLKKLIFSRKRVINFKKVLSFAIPLIFLSIVINLLRSIDLLFLKALTNPIGLANTYAGYYTAALSISKIPFIVILALSFVLFPIISEVTFKKDILKTKMYINKAMRYSLLITVTICFFLSSTAKQLMPFIYPESYVAGSSALIILVIGFGFYALYTMLSTVISGSGRPKVSLGITTIMLFINMALNILLIPKYNMQGAAFATSFSMFFGFIVAGMYVYGDYKALLKWKSSIKIVLVGILIYIASLVYPVREWWLLLKYPILALLMLALLIMFKELTKKDLVFFKNSIFSLLSRKAKE